MNNQSTITDSSLTLNQVMTILGWCKAPAGYGKFTIFDAEGFRVGVMSADSLWEHLRQEGLIDFEKKEASSVTEIREVVVNYNNTGKTYSAIRGHEDAAEIIRKCLVTNAKENFIALYLSGSHEVIAYNVVTVGLANQTQIHPREVFQPAIACGAVAIIIAHNHPSGNVQPSAEDKKVTTRLKEAAEVLGIKLLDHVIVADSDCYSFANNGEM